MRIPRFMGGALVTAALTLGGYAAAAPTVPPSPPTVPLYQNPRAPMEARIDDLLGQMTLPEEMSLLAQQSGNDPLKLDTPPIPRLGIPSLRTIDAPNGIRDGPATSFPMEVVLASTWNRTLVREVGAAIGEEGKAKNRQVVYGPDVNIQRSPQSGRSFECYSEDPFLAAQMAVADIEGMQSQNVAACVKHFICNDQETQRNSINIQVSERALHEIYLPPFRAAIRQAHVWTMMPAFNQVNGAFMTQNVPLLRDLAINRWGWDGLAISDWDAIHDTVPAVAAGTDVEMPNPVLYSPDALTAALKSGAITRAQIDDMARRVLRCMARTGLLNTPAKLDTAAVNSPEHQALALKAAQEGIILLKNAHHLLPLNASQLKSIAVIGPNAADTPLGGRWSAEIVPFFRVSILAGIRTLMGSSVRVHYAQGCPRTGPGSPATRQAAVALAARSQVAVVVVGTDSNYEGENLDPPNIRLPGSQNALIQAVAAANPNTIVVLNNGTPILMTPWIHRVRGVIEGWYAGEEQGNAVADILFGTVNPSGKLTETIAARRNDYSDYGYYPGTNGTLRYGEGIYVGYRHFDQAKIKPLFPFGFGLSYTTFQYGGLKCTPSITVGQRLSVQLSIKNTGQRAGAEVAELYVRPLAPRIDRPFQELKGFQRVSLPPGASAPVTFVLGRRAFAYWDTTLHTWRTDPGQYQIAVGASSRDIRLLRTVRVYAAGGAGR